MDYEFINPIIQSVIGSAIYGVIIIFVLFFHKTSRKGAQFTTQFQLIKYATYLLITSIVAGGVSWNFGILSAESLLANFTLIITIYLCIVLKLIYKYKAIGLVGADLEISSGINYDKSLAMVHEDLSFMGIGASKLTASEEFEDALMRVTKNGGISRFLLCDPNDVAIEATALRAGKGKDAYRDTVKKSLNSISHLRERRNMNIEVRFYNASQILTMPIFRLMILNNSFCLAGYAVYGFNDGRSLPQLHLIKHESDHGTKSFYFPFSQYFEKLWEQSTVWDFGEIK
jgi:hypothetical protein